MINSMINEKADGRVAIMAAVGGELLSRTFSDRSEVERFKHLLKFANPNKEDDLKEVRTAFNEGIHAEYQAAYNKRESDRKRVEGFTGLKGIGILERDGSFYLEGSDYVSMPERLVNEFAEFSDDPEKVMALKSFWMLCMLNPDPRARQDTFKFLADTKMVITPSGMFVAYRNVEVKERNGEEITEDTVFTDAHTKTMTIKIGDTVRLPRNECDSRHDHSCSNGLHVGTESFVRKGSFGNAGIYVLVNPKNVVAVPYDNSTKMRVCEYHPYAITVWDDNSNPEVPYIGDVDFEYKDQSMTELKFALANMSVEELERNIIVPEGVKIEKLDVLIDDIVHNRVIKI